MGFSNKSPEGGSGRLAGIDPLCGRCNTGMKIGQPTLLARLPKQTYTAIRRIHAGCTPSDSPDYLRAFALMRSKQ